MADFEPVQPRMPTAPRNALPPLACDAHCHVFGPYDRFPLSLPSSYSPPDAAAERYLSMLDGVGAGRGCLVQPAPYSGDARALLDAIARAPDRLRGIAVAGPEIPDETLKAWDAGGIRGLRFVEARTPTGERFAGSVGAEGLAAQAGRLRDLGWQAQLWGPVDRHAEWLPEATALGLPLVIDHMAGIKVERGVSDPAFQTVLRYLGQGKVWVKLTVCRTSSDYPAYAAVRPFHDAVVAANPDQVIWGSDWPFVRMGEASPDVGALIDLVHDWVPDAATRRKIFVDNPARLFGF